MMFDLLKDPVEMNNIIQSADTAIVNKMKSALFREFSLEGL